MWGEHKIEKNLPPFLRKYLVTSKQRGISFQIFVASSEYLNNMIWKFIIKPIFATSVHRRTKEIQIIHKLFLIITIYCQPPATSHLASKYLRISLLLFHITCFRVVHSYPLEITYILFELPYILFEPPYIGPVDFLVSLRLLLCEVLPLTINKS